MRRAMALLLVLVMLSSVVSPAMAANTGNTKLKEFKLKQLYRDDKEFKKNIDQIRKILIKDKLMKTGKNSRGCSTLF